MNLCIPTINSTGYESVISEHFGSAPWFMIYDREFRTYEVVPNVKAEHEHGQCRPMDLLEGRDIAAIICKAMGRNAMHGIQCRGIKVFVTGGSTVQDAIEDFMTGRLIKLDPETACQGHDCH